MRSVRITKKFAAPRQIHSPATKSLAASDTNSAGSNRMSTSQLGFPARSIPTDAANPLPSVICAASQTVYVKTKFPRLATASKSGSLSLPACPDSCYSIAALAQQQCHAQRAIAEATDPQSHATCLWLRSSSNRRSSNSLDMVTASDSSRVRQPRVHAHRIVMRFGRIVWSHKSALPNS